MPTPPRTSMTFTLTPEQQTAVQTLLATGNYLPVKVPYARIAARTRDCGITLYTSGKLVVQGKGTEDFVTFILEPQVLGAAALGYEDILNPEAVQPHIGVDESGKGDFLGPLVVAGVYVHPGTAGVLREMHVRDSKTITSDSKAIAMGAEIRRLLGPHCTVVKIGPAAYNRLYAKMRSVNVLLAWGHARAIENLLAAVPDCPRAISDQFGRKEQVERALMTKGQKIELVQRPRAESDIAVAAASIVAREGFLIALKQLGSHYGAPFPKGASPAVTAAARDLVAKQGPRILLETAKCHFRTADVVLEAAGRCRADLGAEGAAISKASTGFPRRKRADPAPAAQTSAASRVD